MMDTVPVQPAEERTDDDAGSFAADMEHAESPTPLEPNVHSEAAPSASRKGSVHQVVDITSLRDKVKFYENEAQALQEAIGSEGGSEAALSDIQLRLALAYLDNEEAGKAHDILKELRPAAEKFWGWDSVHSQEWVRALVNARMTLDSTTHSVNECHKLYTRAIDNTAQVLGTEHPWTIELKTNAGCFLAEHGMYADAGELLVASLVAKRHVFGLHHKITFAALCNLCHLSHSSGNKGEEERFRSKMVDNLEEFNGPPSVTAASVTSYMTETTSSTSRRPSTVSRPEGDYGQPAEQNVSAQNDVGQPGNEDRTEALEMLEFRSEAGSECGESIGPGEVMNKSIHPVSAYAAGHIISHLVRAGKHEEAKDMIEKYQLRNAISSELCAFHRDHLIPRLSQQDPVKLVPKPSAANELLSKLKDVSPSVAKWAHRALKRSPAAIKKWTGMDVSSLATAIGLKSNHVQIIGDLTQLHTLLEGASERGDGVAVRGLLDELRAKCPEATDLPQKAFSNSVRLGSVPVVQMFLHHGVDVNFRDDFGRRPIHYASEYGHEAVLILLIDQGAKMDYYDDQCDTPLDLAIRFNHHVVIRTLMSRGGSLVINSNDDSAQPSHPGLSAPVSPTPREDHTGIETTVVHFYTKSGQEQHRVETFPVEPFVHGDGGLLKLCVGNDDGGQDEYWYPRADFKWIHLPANNMDWIESLMKMLKVFDPGMGSIPDVLGDELWAEHYHCPAQAEQGVHGRFMKPLFQVIPTCIDFAKSPQPLGTNEQSAGPSDSNSFVVFLPFISWETESYMMDMQKTIKDELLQKRESNQKKANSDDSSATAGGGSKLPANAQERSRHLVNKSLFVDPPRNPLHPRRTLDQFYYYMAEETDVRDMDQTVSRYYRRRMPKATVPIMMVDQLWLWVINDSSRDVLRSILDRLSQRGRRPINSVHDLTKVIMSRCLGLGFEPATGKHSRHPSFLEIFEYSINYVVDEETRCFDRFATVGSEKGGKLASKDRATDDLYDISREVELMRDIRDVRDELNILRTLFQQQGEVLASFTPERLRGDTSPDLRLSMTGIRDSISQHLEYVKLLESNSERPYHALRDLLDLKQKQANVEEARTARTSGNTLTVFTIVTVIFLPASFMAAFFAIPISTYPFDEDDRLDLGYVSRHTIGVTVPLAFVFIILAVYVNPILHITKASIKVSQHVLDLVAGAMRRAQMVPKIVAAAAVFSLWVCTVIVRRLKPRTLFWCFKALWSLSPGWSVFAWPWKMRKAKREAGVEWKKRHFFFRLAIARWQKYLQRAEASASVAARDIESQVVEETSTESGEGRQNHEPRTESNELRQGNEAHEDSRGLAVSVSEKDEEDEGQASREEDRT